LVEQLGEDFGEVLAFQSRPASIVKPGAQRLGLACGDILASAPLERSVTTQLASKPGGLAHQPYDRNR
jgi:hypothetical protein